MPSMRVRITSTTSDALANQIFRDIPTPSILNVWAAGVTNSDDLTLLIGSRQILSQSDINVESSADVIDTDRDQLVFNEVVEAGRLTMPVTVTTECQVLISWKPI